MHRNIRRINASCHRLGASTCRPAVVVVAAPPPFFFYLLQVDGGRAVALVLVRVVVVVVVCVLLRLRVAVFTVLVFGGEIGVYFFLEVVDWAAAPHIQVENELETTPQDDNERQRWHGWLDGDGSGDHEQTQTFALTFIISVSHSYQCTLFICTQRQRKWRSSPWQDQMPRLLAWNDQPQGQSSTNRLRTLSH